MQASGFIFADKTNWVSLTMLQFSEQISVWLCKCQIFAKFDQIIWSISEEKQLDVVVSFMEQTSNCHVLPTAHWFKSHFKSYHGGTEFQLI